jgi:hypothetical protein
MLRPQLLFAFLACGAGDSSASSGYVFSFFKSAWFFLLRNFGGNFFVQLGNLAEKYGLL